MDLTTTGIVALTFVLAFYLGYRLTISLARDELKKINDTLTQDQLRYLGVLRRELANQMMMRDPDRYLQLYAKLHDEMSSLDQATKTELRGRFAQLTRKYKFFSDFDLLGTRDYILYREAGNWEQFEDFAERYADICSFQAITMKLTDAPFLSFHITITSDKEYEHLRGYVRDLRSRLETADPHL